MEGYRVRPVSGNLPGGEKMGQSGSLEAQRALQEGEEDGSIRAQVGSVERAWTDGGTGVKGPGLTGCEGEEGGVLASGSTRSEMLVGQRRRTAGLDA